MNTAIQTETPGASSTRIAERVTGLAWEHVSHALDAHGSARLERLLAPDACQMVAGLYPHEAIFRSRVEMRRQGCGRGAYKYGSYPLPQLVGDLRTTVSPLLVPMAHRWNTAMGLAVRDPAQHADFLARCHHAGQVRPTPLLLQYGANAYNCLHHDRDGEHVFPLQLAI
jgi:uncharacterized protein